MPFALIRGLRLDFSLKCFFDLYFVAVAQQKSIQIAANLVRIRGICLKGHKLMHYCQIFSDILSVQDTHADFPAPAVMVKIRPDSGTDLISGEYLRRQFQ